MSDPRPKTIGVGWGTSSRDEGEFARLSVRGDSRTATVTFHYPPPTGWQSVVAPNVREAFRIARERWGDHWEGEPTVSTPESVYRDLIGVTKARHGSDHQVDERKHGPAARRRREGPR